MNRIIQKERIFIKENKNIKESTIQDYINDNPSVLGLGELEVIKKEVPQKSGGRLDFLLYNEEEDTKYEVEIQLGQTDPSHIMRTIEYWDNERKRSPNKNHVAVIIAEKITDRFQNVISLFNKSIPLIAIQMVAFKENDGDISLSFIKIMDLADIDNIKLNYNKFYIGLNINNVSDNILSFVPKKRFLKIRVKMDENQDVENYFDEKGFEIVYCPRLGRKDYTIKVSSYDEYIKIKPKLIEILDELKKDHFIN